MKTTKIISKANDFKFPSLKERKEIQKHYPEIKYFYFDRIKEANAIIEGLPLNQVSRINHLAEWNIALNNRFGKLRETYIYMMANYNRQFDENISSISESKKATNSFLFEYHAEIFYYFFFSAKEIIGQLMRVYFCVDACEDNFYFDRNRNFKNEIKNNPHVERALETFKKSIDASSKLRNKFTHKFTPTQRDYLPIYTESNGVKSLELGRGDTVISPKGIIDDTKELLIILKTLMDTLVIEMK